MKKKLLASLLVLALCVFITGCKDKEEIKEPTVVGGWTLNSEVSVVDIPTEATSTFNKAYDKKKNGSLKPLALLGTQVVSGTNYMFLCKSVENGKMDYKVVVVYKDLEGNSSISKVNNFDIIKYASENISYNFDEVVGGFEVNTNNGSNGLKEEERKTFEVAVRDLDGVDYKPALLLATQVVSGTNYLFLSTGETVTQTPTKLLNVVTVYKDLEGKISLTSISNIDLASFNK